jgi:hypothetical protein
MSAVPRLKQLVVGFSQQGLRFDTRPAHVKFVVDDAALRQIFYGNSSSSVQIIPLMFHHYLHLTCYS